MRVGVLVAALVTAALVGGLVLAGGTKKVGAERYSAYADPEKPVISYLLSDPENVEDFQREFALNDGEMADVLDAVRRENEILAGTFSRSERIVQANRGLSEERVGEKIAASSFDESVRAAVAETKGEVKRILPPGHRSDFRPWVDARWQEKRQEFDQEPYTFMTTTTTTDRGRTFRVYATQYRGHTLREAALPQSKLKFEGGYRVRVRPAGSSDRGWVMIKDVGPWNTHDNCTPGASTGKCGGTCRAACPKRRPPTSTTSTGAGMSSAVRCSTPPASTSPRRLPARSASADTRAPGSTSTCPGYIASPQAGRST